MNRWRMAWRRFGVAASLGVLLCVPFGAGECEAQSSGSFNIGPTGGQVAGALIGVVAVVGVGIFAAVEISHSHHTVKGCVGGAPGALTLTTEGEKPATYRLAGDTANVKAGDVVRLHGDKSKKDAGGGRAFTVQKMNKDYGGCKAAAKAGP